MNSDGFRPFQVRDIEILVGQTVNLNVTLEVAAAATEVQVLDTAPIVEQTRTGNSQVVNSRQILNLPINGRRVDSFALLTPSVVNDGTFGNLSFRGIAGGTHSSPMATIPPTTTTTRTQGVRGSRHRSPRMPYRSSRC